MSVQISESLKHRLSVWKPMLTADEIAASKLALMQGIDRMRKESGVEKPTMRNLIWWLMQDAAETWRRMPDKERSWRLYRVMWPELARPSEECRAVEDQIENEMAIDGIRYNSKHVALRFIQDPPPRLVITDPTAGDRAETVYGWLKFVRGKNPRRDKAAFIALAEGRGSRAAAWEMGKNVTDYAVSKLKIKILRDIEGGLNRCIAFA